MVMNVLTIYIHESFLNVHVHVWCVWKMTVEHFPSTNILLLFGITKMSFKVAKSLVLYFEPFYFMSLGKNGLFSKVYAHRVKCDV